MTLEDRYKGMGEFQEFISTIFDEYFDNRVYLLDLYINSFTRILGEKNLSLDEYIITFLN